MNFRPSYVSQALIASLVLVLGATAELPAGVLPPCPEGAFTIAVVPDTQSYTGQGAKRTPQEAGPVVNHRFEMEMKWLVAQITPQRIVFVSHVGDIVDIDREEEWAVADGLLRPLHGLVPYSLTVGNHDMSGNGDARLFQLHFPAARFDGFPWYLGSYTHDRPDQHVSANNVNSAQLFSGGGLEFIHLSLECNAPDDVLHWAGALLAKHSNRLALITTHMDLGVIEKPTTKEGYHQDPQGEMRWIKTHGRRGNTPAQMWDKLYRRHPNLRMIFSGDQSRVTALHLASIGDHGNTVHRCLSDYGSQGPLRLYRFFPQDNRVEVITYDPIKDELVTSTTHKKERAYHQFILDVDLRAPTRLKNP